jgi:hypothetical protein
VGIKINEETEQKLVVLQQEFEARKDAVVERVLMTLLNVEAKVHPNVKIASG